MAVMLAVIFCNQAAAQGFRRESFPDGSYSPVTNINRTSYPRVLSDNSVLFRVNAPQAQGVQIDLGGTKYDMQKSESGAWTLTTKPQIPGFHYYWCVSGRPSQSNFLRMQPLVKCNRDKGNRNG